ncbi:hypothetical protein PIB30_004407 [Stylosanthes scabra]|uniref:Uncharacterized protein n=1 Tax=Stylosanthes scabra TaxID=79078 RepID=A0ABU6V2D7_9FABA|nr:hypothetical protein [Stylosanthes scabra]
MSIQQLLQELQIPPPVLVPVPDPPTIYCDNQSLSNSDRIGRFNWKTGEPDPKSVRSRIRTVSACNPLRIGKTRQNRSESLKNRSNRTKQVTWAILERFSDPR